MITIIIITSELIFLAQPDHFKSNCFIWYLCIHTDKDTVLLSVIYDAYVFSVR